MSYQFSCRFFEINAACVESIVCRRRHQIFFFLPYFLMLLFSISSSSSECFLKMFTKLINSHQRRTDDGNKTKQSAQLVLYFCIHFNCCLRIIFFKKGWQFSSGFGCFFSIKNISICYINMSNIAPCLHLRYRGDNSSVLADKHNRSSS